MRWFKNYKKLYKEVLAEYRKEAYLHNEASKDIKELDNVVKNVLEKNRILEEKYRSLKGKLGGLTKENHKLKANQKPKIKKIRGTKPKKQEMGIKRTRAGIGARNVLKRTNDLREPTAEDYMLEILKKRRK